MRYFVHAGGIVEGPYEVGELSRKIKPDSLVCPEGGTEWIAAGTLANLAAPSPLTVAVESPPDELPPDLKRLWTICRAADDALLAEQKKRYWRDYFKNEQEIIAAELARRTSGGVGASS